MNANSPIIRDFPTAVIASISTGVLLCEFSAMHEAAEFLMGHPIWTHHFANKALLSDMRSMINEQCPGMPDDLPGCDKTNYREFLAQIERDMGPMVSIRRGPGLTAMLPTDGIPDHLKDSVIVIGGSQP